MEFTCICSDCKDRLEKDIGKLQDKIGEALNYYLLVRQEYGELPGWEMVEDRLIQAISWADLPLQPVPEEE